MILVKAYLFLTSILTVSEMNVFGVFLFLALNSTDLGLGLL